VKPTPTESDEDQKKAEAEKEKKRIAKAALEKEKAAENDTAPKKAVAAQGGNGKGTSPGAGGRAGGAGGESQFGWYGSMLHDRFYSEWVQPNTSLTSGAKASALVKIRIEKDGRVSSFEIIRPSGNAVVDDSVTAVAKRVTQVDPLPAGLGSGEHYDVKINFELNSD
jgi:TolA protein